MKLATTTGDFARITPDQVDTLAYIAEAGFKYIDYNFDVDYDEKRGFFGEEPEKHLENIKAKAKELGLKFVQAHSQMGAPIAEDNADFIEATKKCIAICAELEIPNIVVHSGYRMGLTREETFIENKKFFLDILEYADTLGINVLVENFNKMSIDGMYWIDNVHDLADFIKFVGHKRLHAVWDVGHGNMQELSQYEAVKILGDELYALHVQDNDKDDDLHMFPLLGTANIDALMHGLIEIGYKGYFTFESSRVFFPKKRKFDADSRLDTPSIEVKRKAEALLFEIGRFILSSYDLYTE